MKKLLNKIKRYFEKPIWWHYCNIYAPKQIGKNTKIGSYVEIGKHVIIGKNCKIEAFVFIPDGVIIENNVFIGPGVIFTNDKYPPSGNWGQTIIRQGARIGAGSIILPDIEIAEDTLIGAGSVVTKSTEKGGIYYGSPIRRKN